MTRPWGSTVDRILDILTELGPMTAAEICREMGENRQFVSAVISRMRRPTKQLPKRIYVTSWAHDDEGARRYPRAVFDVGDAPDKEKKKDGRKATRRRSDVKVRMHNTANSVFNLATPRREYQT
jgi:hypothetical protein